MSPASTHTGRPGRFAALGAITALVAAATLAALAPPARAAAPPLVSAQSGRCLDVNGNDSTPGAGVQIWDCNGVAGQGWTLTSAGELRTFDGTRCLDALNWGTTAGTALISWSCTGGANQRFAWGSNGSLVHQQSRLCVDVDGSRTANGTPVHLWTCNGRENQRWSATGSPAPGAYPGPGNITGATWAHDPTVVKRPDGSYLVATTGRGIPLKTSSDRTAWTDAGAAFPNGTPWTSAHTTGDLWAPDLSYRNGQYYLYYSASTFGSTTSGIYLATSTSGNAGTWTNRGLVVSTTASSSYNAIDPGLVVDQQGRWFLSFGSFWSGLKLIAIDPATGLRSGTAITSIASRSGGIEAPDIHYRDGYYYLFVSFDACCRGAQSTYRIAVGRSSSVTGPYVDRNGTAMTSGGGTQILAGHGSIHGPGHSATLTDSDGTVLFYHYYTDAGDARLGINRLAWDSSGWPYVS
ncbi:family 43 glycosylhydrolase [Cellulomonas fengjieae]|uniref:family 43 glycosylhydrolase n=1 Tax=Cellulomonas fengjieae TaxID=2819978 RepID=UPI001AAF3761|nr:family 43 glycosylhydrolase [Cellulomonas fengjieae]MBO3100519.1 family 43 glycosylhydrolase [Cellulomonas fengjieae]